MDMFSVSRAVELALVRFDSIIYDGVDALLVADSTVGHCLEHNQAGAVYSQTDNGFHQNWATQYPWRVWKDWKYCSKLQLLIYYQIDVI